MTSPATPLRYFGKVRYLPLIVGLVYLGATVLLFLLGSFDWPVESQEILLLFLATAYIALVAGFVTGANVRGSGRPFAAWRGFYRIGAFASIALLFPSVWVYTGNWPWEVARLIGDQGAAYQQMLGVLAADDSGLRPYIAIVRAMVAPFVVCVIPFAVLYWRELRAIDLVLLVGYLAAVLTFSLMRGTDRETADLAIFMLTTLLIAAARVFARLGKIPINVRKAVPTALLLALALAAGAVLFVDRKESRMGGADAFCVAEGIACSSDSDRLEVLPPKAKFAVDMLTAYLSQGYYGLSIALDADFDSTYGVGHSSFLMRAASSMFGDSLYERSYLFKVRQTGWDDQSQWSTFFSWVASDIGFPLVPFVMFLVGAIWAGSWRDAVCEGSDAGAIVFILVCQLVFYVPANNQLAQTLDSYLVVVFWAAFWSMQRISNKPVTPGQRPRPS